MSSSSSSAAPQVFSVEEIAGVVRPHGSSGNYSITGFLGRIASNFGFGFGYFSSDKRQLTKTTAARVLENSQRHDNASNTTAEMEQNAKPTLDQILSQDVDSLVPSDANANDENAMEQNENQDRSPVREGTCVECESHPSQVHCVQCCEDFCEVCYAALHRKGTRLRHETKRLATAPNTTTNTTIKSINNISNTSTKDNEDQEMADTTTETITVGLTSKSPDYFLIRSKYIPLRLTLEERKYLRLLDAALNVSEYVDRIDIVSYSSKAKRIVAQIKELCSVISGLVLAADYKAGQELFQDRDFACNAQFFQDIFELGRRFKIMNPEKMRNTYGKLIYMLQDSQIPEVSDMLGFQCVRPLKTVYALLEHRNCLELLKDEVIEVATMEILSEGKSRREVQNEIRRKERAIEYLAKKYKRKDLDEEKIKLCLYSIGDNHAYLRFNRDPCDKMISLLEKYFKPDSFERSYSLGIQYGKEGSRLTHDHQKQYAYVLQSLSLWREILHDMFMLWTLSEEDLLDEDNMYRLRDTGQGLNRTQSCPRVGRTMQMILGRAQRKMGYWVGSSVIHLGDHNVPNALMFIDKYTQVSRILNPVVRCIEEIDTMLQNRGLERYISETFGGGEKLKKDILCDFFRHAFDGSGSDNFFDAGSCIDGRLTSAWNWCSMLEKKSYHPVFLLSGFMGFDGKFE